MKGPSPHTAPGSLKILVAPERCRNTLRQTRGWDRPGPAVCRVAESLQAGFTLLEIMVVVVLIALTVSLISLNLERDVDQIARLEAFRFAKLVDHVREESILTGKVYAIEVDENGKSYRFMENAKAWEPVRNDDLLRKRKFPEYISVRFDTLQPAGENDRGLLVVQGLGDITPFELVVSGDDFRQVVKLDDAFNVIVEQVARDES